MKTMMLAGLCAGVALAQTTEEPVDCWDAGEDQMTNNADDHLINFVNYPISGFVLPFALDKCSGSSLVTPSESHKFTCNADGTEVTRQAYSDARCTTTDGDPETWGMDGWADVNDSSQAYAFECNGEVEYVKTLITALSVCGGSSSAFINMYASLARCAANPEFDVNVYCDENRARIQFFAPGAYCMDPYQCKGNFTTTECEPWFATSLGLIHGSMVRCVTRDNPNPITTDGIITTDSASAHSALLAALVALAAAAFN